MHAAAWDSAYKCLAPDRLIERAPKLEKPLAFTNCVFDLPHLGHVLRLQAAAREGSTLVVALNGDASARRLGKPGERPLCSCRTAPASSRPWSAWPG